MPGGAHEHMKVSSPIHYVCTALSKPGAARGQQARPCWCSSAVCFVIQAWDPEEDHIIMEMHAAEGPKWKSIVKRLPGRTVSSVRNRWQRIEKGRKLREEGTELKNRCHACGQPKRGHICYAKMRGGPQVELSPKPNLGIGTSLGNPEPLVLPGHGDGGLPRFPGSTMGPPSGGPGSFPSLRRTRSGSKLVPVDGAGPSAAGGLVTHHPLLPPFSVDVEMAQGPGGPAGGPSLARTNTSFFKDLVASDLFSPNSREMFQAWADSPHEAPDGVHAVAGDVAAPPSLRRVASGSSEQPKLTRSVTSYLREMSDDPPVVTSSSPFAVSSNMGPPTSISRQA